MTNKLVVQLDSLPKVLSLKVDMKLKPHELYIVISMCVLFLVEKDNLTRSHQLLP